MKTALISFYDYDGTQHKLGFLFSRQQSCLAFSRTAKTDKCRRKVLKVMTNKQNTSSLLSSALSLTQSIIKMMKS